MQDHYVSGAVSALVLLAAIGLTFTTYAAYKDETATAELERATAGMENAANVMLSYKIEKAAKAAAASSTQAVEESNADEE